MSNKASSTCACIIPFPNLDDVMPSGWEILRNLSLKEEPRPEKKDLDEKVEIKQEEQAKEGDDDTTPNEYPPNPYEFNIHGYIPLFPLGPPQVEWGKEPRTPEEMKEKIRELERVSKACVNVIEGGIDSYQSMCKDQESRVDGHLHKVRLMIDALTNNTTQLEFLTQVVDGQQIVTEGMKKKLKSICTAFRGFEE